MGKIICFFAIYGVFVYVFLETMIMFMPIYRSDFCEFTLIPIDGN